MKSYLKIRRNSDGIIRCYPTTWDWYGDFIWEEGNFACDCNRGDFFAKAGDEEDSDHECGDGDYSVFITDKNGVVLYKDGEWW